MTTLAKSEWHTLQRRTMRPIITRPARRSSSEKIASYSAGRAMFGGYGGYGGYGGGYGYNGDAQFIPTLDQFRCDPRSRRMAVRLMLSDPIVKAGVLQKALAVKQLDLEATPADAKRKTDQNAADFCTFALTQRIAGLLPGLIWNIVHPALLDGVGVCEPVWPKAGVVEERGRWKGKRVLLAVKPKPPDSYQLQTDEFGNIIGVLPAHDPGAPPLDPKELIIFQWLPLYGDPRGMSDLESSYKAYLLKLNATRLRELYLDRLTGPFLESHTNDPDDPGLKADLAAARACGYICLDRGDDIKIHDLAAGSDEAFNRAIEDCDRQILVGIIGSYLHVLESKQANTRGDTQEHRGVTELYEWDLAASVSAVFTEQLAPMLVRANFAGAGFALLNLSDVDTAYAKAQLAFGETLRNNGVDTRKSQWYEISGWDDPTGDDEDTLPGQAKAPVPAFGQGGPGAGPSSGGPGVKPVPPVAPSVVPTGPQQSK